MPLLRLLFSFRGRIGRRAFLAGVAFWTLAAIGALSLLWTENFLLALLLIVLVPVMVVSICALQAKRFHDRGRSGWRTLVFLVLLVTDPLLAISEHTVEMIIVGGAKGSNRHGPSRRPAAAAIAEG